MMYIRLKCPKGHDLKVYENLVGSRMRCPRCDETFVVPEFASDSPDPVTVPATDYPAAEDPASRPTIAKPIPREETKNKKRAPASRRLVGLSVTLGILILSIFVRGRFTDPVGDLEDSDESNRSSGSASLPVRVDPKYGPKYESKIESTSPSTSSVTSRPVTQPARSPVGFQNIPRDDGIRLYRLASTAWSSAYDPENGRLALSQEDKKITIHSIDRLIEGVTTPETTIEMRSRPQALCYKQFGIKHWFIYCEADYPVVSFVDSRTGNVDLQIPISVHPIIFLASSRNPLDPNVYFLIQRETPGSKSTSIGRIDLNKRQTDIVANVPFVDFQIHPDGDTIYAKKTNPDSSGLSYFFGDWKDLQNHEKLNRKSVRAQSEYGGSVRIINDNVAIRSNLLAPAYSGNEDLELIQVGQAKFEPLASFDSFPIAIGLSKDGIAVGSSLTGIQHLTLSLPPELMVRNRADSYDLLTSDSRCCQRFGDTVGRAKVEAFTDSKRELGILTIDDHLMIIPCSSKGLQDNHPLLSSLRLPSVIQAGEVTEIRLPQGMQNHKVQFGFQLEQPPWGEELTKSVNLPEHIGDVIRWSPDLKLVGKQDILITGSFGEEKRQWRWPVEITSNLTPASFDFRVQGVSGSPDSNLAVVWGVPDAGSTSSDDPDQRLATNAPEGILAIYDVSSQSITQQIQLPYDIDYAALHSSGIYATSRNASAYSTVGSEVKGLVLRFDRESMKRTGAFPLQYLAGSASYRLLFQGSDQMVAFYKRAEFDNGSRKTLSEEYRFRIPELEILEQTQSSSPPVEGLIGDCPIQYGILWDPTLKTPQLLVDASRFSELFSNAAVLVPEGIVKTSLIGSHPTVLAPKDFMSIPGTHLPNSNTIVRAASDRLVVLQGHEIHQDTKVEVGNSIFYGASSSGGQQHRKWEKKPISRVDLINTEQYEAVCGSFVYSTAFGKLYRIPIVSLPSAPEPFSIKATQDHFVVDAGKKIQWKYTAPGANKFRLQIYLNADASLLREDRKEADKANSKCICLESTDGSFEYTFEKEQVTEAILSELKRSRKLVDLSDIKRVLKPINQIQPAYKALTKRNPATIPAVATMVLVATHQDGQQKAALMHAMLVEVPLETILRQAPTYFRESD
jgi:hypothetical protein